MAEKLQYQPNYAAASLRSRRSNALGVLVPQISSPFFGSALDGIHEATQAKGYYTVICQSNESDHLEVEQIKLLLSSQVEGVIVSLSGQTGNYDHLALLRDRNIPFVVFDRVVGGLDVPKVEIDDFGGGKLATAHLIEQGYRRIAHLGGPEKLPISQSRYQGYLSALYDAGIEPHIVEFSEFNCFDAASIGKIMSRWREMPDAIFAFSDEVAVWSMMWLKQKELDIPGEVAVVGFGDGGICHVVEPNLTSVTQDPYLMGQKAAELLFAQMKESKKGTVVQNHKFAPKLVARASSLKKG